MKCIAIRIAVPLICNAGQSECIAPGIGRMPGDILIRLTSDNCTAKKICHARGKRAGRRGSDATLLLWQLPWQPPWQ